ncbi:hypothetical protein C0992_011069 [Termitomyces sp. T32_za158]|nr:hypothetical protein C0992_011069 [Termitomyces sp. T32_za158]
MSYPPNSSELPYHSRSRNSSWDLLAGIKKLEHSYEEFDTRNSSQAHLVYADGDIPKSKIWRMTDRIADQKFAVKSLVTLYRNSKDLAGRSDDLQDEPSKRGSVDAKRFFKKFRQGVRMAATTTTTALGNVASEIAGR